MAKGKKFNVKNMWPMVGTWSFVIGLVISVVAAVWTGTNSTTALVLGALGLIVGILNVTDREVLLFLVSAVTFVIAAQSLGGVLSVIPGIGGMIPALLANVVIFVAPAAGIVALRALYEVARSA